MDNKLMAKIIYANKFADKVILESYWKQVTPEKNIGILLNEANIITQNQLRAVLVVLEKYQQGSEATVSVDSTEGLESAVMQRVKSDTGIDNSVEWFASFDKKGYTAEHEPITVRENVLNRNSDVAPETGLIDSKGDLLHE